MSNLPILNLLLLVSRIGQRRSATRAAHKVLWKWWRCGNVNTLTVFLCYHFGKPMR